MSKLPTFLAAEYEPNFDYRKNSKIQILIKEKTTDHMNSKREIRITHRISNDDVGRGVVSAEVEANFHAGIPAADDQNLLFPKLRPRPIITRVKNGAVKPANPCDFRYHGLGILAGGDDQPRREIDDFLGPNPPKAGDGVEPSFEDRLLEFRLDREMAGVGLHIGDELILGGIFREIIWEIEQRELAELLGEVEFEAIVGSVLPERGDAVAALEDEGGDAALAEACGGGEARGAGAYDDGAGMEQAVYLVGRSRFFHLGEKRDGEEGFGFLLLEVFCCRIEEV